MLTGLRFLCRKGTDSRRPGLMIAGDTRQYHHSAVVRATTWRAVQPAKMNPSPFLHDNVQGLHERRWNGNGYAQLFELLHTRALGEANNDRIADYLELAGCRSSDNFLP